MGCSSSRLSENKEESFIQKCERDLGYFNSKSQEIDRTIHRYSVDLKMTANQFLAAAYELKLSVPDQNQVSLEKFYESFKDHLGNYDARKLGSLGILLGKGSIKEKALILFQNYDTDISRTISCEEFTTILKDLVDISLGSTPHFALSKASQSNKNQLAEYVKKLQIVKSTVVDYLKTAVFENVTNELSIQNFKLLFEQNEVCCLVSSSKLRKLALKKYQEIVVPANITLDLLRDEAKFKDLLNHEIAKEMYEES